MSNNTLMSLEERFIDRLNQVIDDNIANESFNVNDLSTFLFLSNSQIFRKIKDKTGLSPSNYILRKRLEQAMQLIQQTNLSISEIAYQVGFNSASYFSRCFSDVYGYPPSSLRK